jgi:SAM-dependent methyltransferase
MNNESKEQEYVTGLELYLDVSHEDILIAEAILEQMPQFVPNFLQKLKDLETLTILDVGSGNGLKAIYLAQQLQRKNAHIRIIIDSIEPKREQGKKLCQNYQKTSFFGELFTDTLENAKLSKSYDLVIILHSLYEFPRDSQNQILSLNRLKEIVSPHGCGVIAIEAPEGDFQKMKRELYPRFGKKEHLSLSIVTNTLEKGQIPFQIGNLIDYNSPLNHLLDLSEAEIGKQLAFLFSDSLLDVPLKDEQYKIVGQWVKNNQRVQNELSNLHTPDILVWLYPQLSQIDE